MRFVQYSISIVIFILVLFLAPYNASAGAPSFQDRDPEGTPIDGGIGLLAAAGAGYGIRKLRRKRENDMTPSDQEKRNNN